MPIRMLVRSSLHNDKAWKNKTISRAKLMVQRSDIKSFTAWAMRKSVLLRREGSATESNILMLELEEELLKNRCSPTPWTRAQLALIGLSRSEAHTHADEFGEAENILKKCIQKLEHTPSSLERIALLLIKIQLGKIIRYQGCFSEAKDILETAYETALEDDLYKDIRRQALLELIDVCVENDVSRARELLNKVEITSWNHRLTLSSAEILLQEGEVEDAQRGFDVVIEAFSKKLDSPNLSLLRAYVGAARSLQTRFCKTNNVDSLAEAVSYWTKALEMLLKAFAPEAEGRVTAMVLLSSAVCSFEMGNREQAYQSLANLQPHRKDMTSPLCFSTPQGGQFWIPGFGGQFLTDVLVSLRKHGVYFS